MSTESEATLHQQLGRIEGKLDALNASMVHAHVRIDKHDDRISAIETSLAKYAAYAAIGATALSLAAGWIGKKLFGV